MRKYERLAEEIWETVIKEDLPKKKGWPKGKKHTEETKRKMSEIKIEHEVNEGTRQKISEGNTGCKRSEETKRKISISQIIRQDREKKEKEVKDGTT